MDEVAQSQQNKSSKNMLIIGGVVILLFVGIGAYYVLGTNKKQATSEKTMVAKPSVKPASVFSSIQDAFSKSLSLKCMYEENGKKTTTYIKAGSVRADMVGETIKENGSIIVKDKKMYFWNGKEGVMMTFDMEAMKQQNEKMMPSGTISKTQPTSTANADFIEQLEKYKDACKPATVSDSLFTPPADVKFVDQTRMMEDAQKMMKGITPGQSMNEEDVKKLMQQYQPSTTP